MHFQQHLFMTFDAFVNTSQIPLSILLYLMHSPIVLKLLIGYWNQWILECAAAITLQ